MPDFYTVNQAIEFGLLVLCIGREARGEGYPAMLGVGWSIRNRVTRPAWWGSSWIGVISKPEQYSSMVPPSADNDPNLRVYPDLTGASSAKWDLVVQAAEAAYWRNGNDPTNGATHYYDRSLDDNPPGWTKGPGAEHTCDIGDLHFWRMP